MVRKVKRPPKMAEQVVGKWTVRPDRSHTGALNIGREGGGGRWGKGRKGRGRREGREREEAVEWRQVEVEKWSGSRMEIENVRKKKRCEVKEKEVCERKREVRKKKRSAKERGCQRR